MTRLGTVWPVVMFRLDATGRGSPAGQTVTKLGVVGSVTVMLMATAATPAAGTPPRPVTASSRVVWASTAPMPAKVPSTVDEPGRVSNNRAGDTGTNGPGAEEATLGVATCSPGRIADVSSSA